MKLALFRNKLFTVAENFGEFYFPYEVEQILKHRQPKLVLFQGEYRGVKNRFDPLYLGANCNIFNKPSDVYHYMKTYEDDESLFYSKHEKNMILTMSIKNNLILIFEGFDTSEIVIKEIPKEVDIDKISNIIWDFIYLKENHYLNTKTDDEDIIKEVFELNKISFISFLLIGKKLGIVDPQKDGWDFIY